MAKKAKGGKAKAKGLNQVWTVNVWVSDMERSVEFYTQKLGLKVALADSKDKWVELSLPGGFTKIALREPTMALGESYYKYMTQMIGTSTGIAFETSDINVVYEDLKAKGVKFEEPPKKMPWGGIMTTFVDPDGNEFGIVEDADHYKRKY